MRSFVRRVLVLGGCVVAAVVASGCEGKQATEYVAGVSTQVSVPQNLTAIRINISVGGVSVFCKGFQVFNGRVLLPRSLGAYAQTDSAANGEPVTFEVVGLTTQNLDSEFFASCGLSSVRVNGQDVRVLRRSRQPYEPNVIKFLPMPIKYSCYDKNCGDEETCKGGKCMPMDTPKETLPEYSPDLVDGTGGTCFRVKNLVKGDVTVPGCMDPGTPDKPGTVIQAIPVNGDDCTYAVPGTPSAPNPSLILPEDNPIKPFDTTNWKGVNVEVTYDGGLLKEILDKDKDEGFFIPDPAKPQQFRLAEGLCEMVKGLQKNPNFGKKIPDTDQDEPEFIPTEHRITSVRTSGLCQAKTIAQPFCAEDIMELMSANPDGSPKNDPVCKTTELLPPPSALVVVVDNTTGQQRLYEKLKAPVDPTDEESLIEPAIRNALADPAFRNTQMGLIFTPGNKTGGEECSASAAFDIPLAPTLSPGADAQSASTKFLEAIKAEPIVSGPVALEGSLARAYATLQSDAYKDYYRRAVLVLANGGFADGAACLPAEDSPATKAADAFSGAGGKPIVSTYVMQLLSSPGKDGTSDALAAAGGTTAASWKTKDSTTKFSEIVNSLATCVYDVSGPAPGAAEVVAFTSPLTAQTTKLAFNASCNAEGVDGEGWGVQNLGEGKSRVHLCKGSCTKYRDALQQASQFAAIYQQDPIPVPVYKYQATCAE